MSPPCVRGVPHVRSLCRRKERRSKGGIAGIGIADKCEPHRGDCCRGEESEECPQCSSA